MPDSICCRELDVNEVPSIQESRIFKTSKDVAICIGHPWLTLFLILLVAVASSEINKPWPIDWTEDTLFDSFPFCTVYFPLV